MSNRTIAHELGHVRILGEGGYQPVSTIMSLTDLLTVFLGMGCLLEIRCSASGSGLRLLPAWQTERRGYMKRRCSDIHWRRSRGSAGN